MKIQTRSLNNMVEEQLKKWQIESKERKTVKAKPGPVITISREAGSGGSEIARRLAEDLNMGLIGAQIIQKLAESSDMSAKVIKSLDEREVTRRDDFLTALFETRHLFVDQYLFHLTKVIGTFGRQGNFIIVGRGSQYILPPESTFRLRFVAPLETRIQNVMRDSGCTREDAESYIAKTDENRRAYLRKHFKVDWTNPTDYDLIINTGCFGIEGSVELIKEAFTVWKKAWAAIP